MTIDDESSIYVGGLPYDIGEDNLRKIFYLYGAVVAVKIINDRNYGGKCYGFVTFSNPRSATQAIREMDGKTIDGRVVRVNEVRTRNGRPNFSRDNSQRDLDNAMNGDRNSDHGRDDAYDQYYLREGHRKRSLDPSIDRQRGHNQNRGRDRSRNRYMDDERNGDYSRQIDSVEQGSKRKRERDWDRDSDLNMEEHNNTNNSRKGGDSNDRQNHDLPNRSSVDDRENRELSLDSLSNEQDESKLATSNQKLGDLRVEISQMEEIAAEQRDVASALREKCQKLEDSLATAKKLTSHRHLQLAKLCKCYLQIRDYSERLKNSEQEFQLLVDSIGMELGNDSVVVEGQLLIGRS